uniref:Importin N-terminal domain-containing protein n=1 Tax=Rhabditophanes sp. KR3021 TaxID=114890 RepID=A0AC35TYB5_9BILA
MMNLTAVSQRIISNIHGDEENYLAVILELSTVLRNTGNTVFLRHLAGVQLKKLLEDYPDRWRQLENNTRIEVRNNVLQTIRTESHPSVASIASICIAAIADIEIPNNLWENGIESLCELVTPGTNDAAIEVVLQAIGDICSGLEVAVLKSKSNVILTAIAYGMRGEETNLNIKRAAVKAMFNFLDFTENNFNWESDRNGIMELVCVAAQSADTTVKVTALKCLVKIMSLYYNLMQPWMCQDLISITVSAMQSGVTEVVLQGIEFWSKVAKKEIAKQQHIEEARENGAEPAQFTNFYARREFWDIIPIILQLLVKGDDDDNWTTSESAGNCLQLLAQYIGDDIIEFIYPFITIGFSHADWRLIEAAGMASFYTMKGMHLKRLLSRAVPQMNREDEMINEII